MAKERIVITRKLPAIAEAVTVFPSDWDVWVSPKDTMPDRSELAAELATATGVLMVVDRLDQELIDQAPRLRAAANYGVGLDNIDLEAAERRGIVVTNLPHEVTYSTAELALALILACSRRICALDRFVRQHSPFVWTPTLGIGTSLQGKRLGLVGFGRIGQRTARMAKAFELDICYYDRQRQLEAERELQASYLPFDRLLEQVDVLSLHVPGGPDTEHLIGAAELARMKPGAILINTARGTVVDEGALADALTSHLGAAGLDVFEHEPAVDERLLAMENVVLTPHVGASTWETRAEMTRNALANLYRSLLEHPG